MSPVKVLVATVWVSLGWPSPSAKGCSSQLLISNVLMVSMWITLGAQGDRGIEQTRQCAGHSQRASGAREVRADHAPAGVRARHARGELLDRQLGSARRAAVHPAGADSAGRERDVQARPV